jgi:anaerobic magnesium-protoporphyrin IX monomethyl ester cyclase
MAKVLLVSPPYYKPYSKGQTIADGMPLGLGYIASYALSKMDVDIKVIDYGIEQYSDDIWKQVVNDYKPDIIGFNTLTLGYQQVLKMARLVKGNALIVAGGAHATIMPQDMLQECDIIVRCEGEITFSEILSGKPLQNIDGIAYKYDGQIRLNNDRKRIDNLDELPIPAYQLFNMKGYRIYGILGSRGCPYDCLFCASPVLWNRVMRLRSPKNIVNEIQYLTENYEVKHIFFQDDTFNLTIKRGIDICDEMIERNLGITFATQMRANKECVSDDLFRKMKEANCVEMSFGIESYSNKVMKALNKNLTTDEAKQAVRMAHRERIKSVKGFFMIGNWDETPIDILKTWWFIIRNPIDTTLTVCTPLPGTKLYKQSKGMGYLDNVDWSKVNWVTPIARTNKMSKQTILLYYYLTVLFIHLPAHIRNRNSKRLLSGIWNYGLKKMRLIK